MEWVDSDCHLEQAPPRLLHLALYGRIAMSQFFTDESLRNRYHTGRALVEVSPHRSLRAGVIPRHLATGSLRRGWMLIGG